MLSLLLDLELHLVVDGVRAMLLVLSGWRLPRHLHLHRARQKQLLLLLLVLKRVDAVGGHACLRGCLSSSWSHHIVLKGLGRDSCRGRLMVGHTSGLALWLLVVMLVKFVDV